MKRYWVLVLIAWICPAKAAEVTCPPVLNVAQSASDVPGWYNGGEKERGHLLEYIAVGSMDNSAPFREDDEQKRGQVSKSIWMLSDSKTSYAIDCIYNSTDMILYKPVLEHTQRCESYYRIPKFGPYKFLRMECQ